MQKQMEEENEIVQNIENTFRNSCSSGELFDKFHYAIKKKISDPDLYKILLANPALSFDEVKMFANKATKEFPEHTYSLSLWTAKILEQKVEDYDYLDHCLYYFVKAIQSKPFAHEAYINLINLYNTEINQPLNSKIMEIINGGILAVEKKSKVYHSLSLLYKRMNDEINALKYAELAAKSAKSENNF